ncbi:hypothetical protein M5D96_002592 [Drosophila gunungcola]|uniref:FLYWCH-type domain-containing protein n=1 Tax=Drosophila gunungcola TaxID=103775 RepID=A0A9P9Z080_9MUSC|nr:hypothetical protein M5D96_002592 [Drosophila gunungcola]
MLVYEGYRYVVNRQSLKNIFWRCSRYVKHSCRATLVTSKIQDVTIRIAGAPHTHVEIKMEPSPTPGLPTDASVAALAVTYLSDDESFRKPFTLPKILDGKFYKNIQPNQKTPGAIQATCTTCYGLISGTTKSTGNFLSHIKRRHKELLPLCQLYCQAKANGTVPAVKNPLPNPSPVVTSTTPTVEMMTQVTQMPAPTYATAPTHLAMPVTVPVPVSMSLAMPLSLPHVQTPQMMALMQQHQAHGAVFISKDY